MKNTKPISKANCKEYLQNLTSPKFDRSKFYQAKLESYRVQNTPFTFQTKKLYLGDASYVKVGIPEKLQIPKIDFFEADFYYQTKNKKKFLENTNGETNKPLFVWQDKTQPVPNPKNYSAILFDFKMPVFDIRFIYQKFMEIAPLYFQILFPKKNLQKQFFLARAFQQARVVFYIFGR